VNLAFLAWGATRGVYDEGRVMRASLGRLVRCVPCVLAGGALSLSAGCSQIVGLGDITYVDAPPGGNPECPTAPANTVIACATITHVRADGTTFTTKKDLSHFTVAAYIADTSRSGFRVVSGVASSEGIARIEDVPDGASFYFRIQDPQEPLYAWPHYFYTDRHNLEIGNSVLGRDDTPATSSTAVTVNMTGMTPWKQGDTAVLVSFETGTQVGLIGARSLVPVGATMLTGTADWSQGSGEATFSDFTDAAARVAQLIDQSAPRNDDLWALHLTTTINADNALHPFNVSTIADAVNLSGVTLSNGKPVTVGGAFQAAPPVSSALSFSMSSALVRSAFRDANRYSSETVGCLLYATPAASRGLVMAGSALVSIIANDTVATTSGINASVPYTNPFPASMQPLMACTVGHVRMTSVPGTMRMSFGYSYLTSYTPLPTNNNFTFAPPLHSVTNLKIGGVDGLAGGTVPFDGDTPVTMSWDPVPGVTHYQVRVKDETLGVFLAVFDTTQSSVVIPADTFTRGNFYVFRVFAIETSGAYVGGKVFDFQAPLWSARLSTAMFRFSNLCGNGVMDPGEECDPGTAQDAICDPDCTMSVCGDGFVNEKAGEQCDDVVESPFCNAEKCRVPVCGDGVQNRRAGEECDDGNLVNGDNCSAQCKLEGCGNGKTEAGENCDDGNRINGDGCDAFCQIEARPF
jgi:cysteine-rich repeat protein